jgi:hypothetical protein
LFDTEADITKLPIEQTHLRKQEQYMFTSCFGRTRRQYKWSLFQGQEHFVRTEPPDSIVSENSLYPDTTDLSSVLRGWSGPQQVPKEWIIRSGTQAEHLRIVPMELLPQAVGHSSQF